MSPVTIGIDLGTSGVKVLALTPDGRTVASAHAMYPLLTPQPGWTEQRPSDWLEGTKTALTALMAQLEGHAVVGVGVAGQMHGAVFLDAQLNVIRPAPLWNDQRTAVQCAVWAAAVPDLIARTGNAAVTGFQLPKLLWLRDAEPEHFERVRHVLFPKDYLNLMLTGEIAGEPSDASGCGAMNIHTQSWDGDILRALNLSPSLFPALHPSSAVIGRVTAAFAAETGVPAGVPVVAGAGDNAGAAIGLGVSSATPEIGSVSLGTSGVLIAPLTEAKVEPEGRVHLFCHADGGYFLLGVTLAAAGSLQWWRDHGLKAGGVSFDDLMREAEGVSDGADGVTYMPYLAGERSPHLDPHLRGAFLGLALSHGRAHMTRAILEGVAFSLRDTLEVMKPLCNVSSLLAVGGGASSPLWLRLTGAALGKALHKPDLEEGPARGAAILALVGAGVHTDVAAAIGATKPASSPVPHSASGALEAAYARYARGLRAVQMFNG
jgi:xylulokinase